MPANKQAGTHLKPRRCAAARAGADTRHRSDPRIYTINAEPLTPSQPATLRAARLTASRARRTQQGAYGKHDSPSDTHCHPFRPATRHSSNHQRFRDRGLGSGRRGGVSATHRQPYHSPPDTSVSPRRSAGRPSQRGFRRTRLQTGTVSDAVGEGDQLAVRLTTSGTSDLTEFVRAHLGWANPWRADAPAAVLLAGSP